MSRSRANSYVSGLLVALMVMLVATMGCGKRSASTTSLSQSGSTGGQTNSPQTPIPVTITVVDETGAPVNGFRWLLELDNTYTVVPGAPGIDTLGVRNNIWYSPVLQSGTEPTLNTVTINIPDDIRTMLTVMPLEQGYQLGAANIAAGQATVNIVCHTPPLPTGQLWILAFEDNQPLNGAPDVPAEPGLPGFRIIIQDIMGFQMMDAFGNPLGTTYQQNLDGSFVLVDGEPVVDMMGTDTVTTDATGQVLVKNLNPGIYSVTAIPPVGTDWVQTSTIEGKPYVDTWPLHNEPPYFTEAGFFGWHAFYGFIHPTKFPAPTGPVSTITGQVVYIHENKPPLSPGINPGNPVPTAWVSLNDLNNADLMVLSQPCDENGNFTMENVPPSTYQLVLWDYALDLIIDFRTVVVPAAGGPIDLGKVGGYAWFGTLEGNVFGDINENGIQDPGEMGIVDMNINIRMPDGSMYQSTKTNDDGEYNFYQVFPFFHWIVPEVDFIRYKATGATIVVDDGGALPPGLRNNPQLQPDNGNLPYRVELGEVITENMTLYADQVNQIYFGKTAYGPGENGGLSGVVYYDTTRAENDPRWGTGEGWQPGVPRVQFALYEDNNIDGVVDDLDGDTLPTQADVDNWPFGWMSGGTMGTEDVDWNTNGTWDPGDAIQIDTSDSFDDSNPTGVVGPQQFVHGVPIPDGVEMFRNYNQVRPGTFDGAYAFNTYVPGGMVTGAPVIEGIPGGYYIVQVFPPPGYQIVKEEDKNVDFGEIPTPAPLLPELGPPPLVGALHTVPAELTLFPGVPSVFAGQDRPLADMKQVKITEGKNAAADFFLFTEVPKSARIWGLVFNDLALTSDPNSPWMANNLPVSWLPISIKDWTGREVARVFTDEWGKYNALVPSTYSVNPPAPSGVAPNILQACLNDPGPVTDPLNPTGPKIIDPWYNPTYDRPCSNWHFLPGKTTELDTPILPIGAFAVNEKAPDCEFPNGTPQILQVNGDGNGPYVSSAGGTITITSRGNVTMANPDPGLPATISRDYGFGATTGTVKIGAVTLATTSWTNTSITATVPAGTPSGQLTITRGDNGITSLMGIKMWIGGPDISSVIRVDPPQLIQDAIDGAPANALILVGPGTYQENPILWKPLKLQGSGPYSTIIQAGPLSPDGQTAWSNKMNALVTAGNVDLIPGERADFFMEVGAGITVAFAQAASPSPANPASIDGFKVWMAVMGGGIFVNAYAPYTQISNNRLITNSGTFGGGIRIGTPSIINATGDGFESSFNQGINIQYNHITFNGSTVDGGGIGIFNGSDDYNIRYNYICGNHALNYGGAIAHLGLSDNCNISFNTIKSNESFDEGGGIMITGELVPPLAPAGMLTPGSGSIVVNSNYIVGNLGGNDGGALRVLNSNGLDVQNNPSDPTQWYEIDLFNNMIVNNVSADGGGGMSLTDAANMFVINNTIAHNDSTSTGSDAFGGVCQEGNPPGSFCPPGGGGGGLTTSIPQAAGILSTAHDVGLVAAFGAGYEQTFSDPTLEDNIIYQNRSFYWDAAYNGDIGGLRPDIALGEPAYYWDLTVAGTAVPSFLDPMNSILTSMTTNIVGGGTYTYDASNVAANPLFVDGTYFNSFYATSKGAALGNFVMVTFLMPTSHGDYHIQAGSPAIGLGGGNFLGTYPELGFDIDANPRTGPSPDAGADQL